MKYSTLVCLICFGCLPLWSQEPPHDNPKENSTNINQNIKKLVAGNNAFAVHVYQNVKKKNGNILFSPFSISSALSMTYAGAKGETKAQMANALQFNLDEPQLAEAFSAINKKIVDHVSYAVEDQGAIVANSLWIQQGLTLVPDFLKLMTSYYSAGLHQADFINQTETVRNAINGWVMEKTKGKIIDLIKQRDIDKQTRLVLVSTIYLKEKWTHFFKHESTHQGPFFPDRETTISVEMMTNTSTYRLVDSGKYTVIELPYQSRVNAAGELAMLIILPSDVEGLDEVESSLNGEVVFDWLSKLKNNQVTLTMPKFKVEDSYNLNDVMESLGMTDAFSNKADFTGITAVKGLAISNIIHKAFMTVDEDGTEAAAATGVSMNLTSVLNPKPPIIINVDRPFLCFIVEKNTGTILFMGRFVQP